MTYTKQEFNGCRFNPLNEQRMLEAYPVLCEIVLPEWTNDPYLDQLIRYTIAVYDPTSPLMRTEKDLTYRKDAALQLALIEDEEVQAKVVACIYGEGAWQVELIVRFFIRFVKSKEAAAIAAFEAKYWESIKIIMLPINTANKDKDVLDAVQKKSAVSEEIDKDILRLEKYYEKFYGGDKELEAKAKKRVTPEMIANGKK